MHYVNREILNYMPKVLEMFRKMNTQFRNRNPNDIKTYLIQLHRRPLLTLPKEGISVGII